MGKRKMVPIGGSKPQMRRASSRSWSAARASEFLAVLAETLNVSEACRVSGLSSVAVYRRRKSDAAFRAGWGGSVAEAYRRLELVLLERAFNGVEKVIRRRDGSEERMREYPNDLALRLLKMHRDTAMESETESEFPIEEMDEVRARLMRKLQRLKKRNESQEAQAQQLRDRGPDEASGGSAGGASEDRHQRDDR